MWLVASRCDSTELPRSSLSFASMVPILLSLKSVCVPPLCGVLSWQAPYMWVSRQGVLSYDPGWAEVTFSFCCCFHSGLSWLWGSLSSSPENSQALSLLPMAQLLTHVALLALTIFLAHLHFGVCEFAPHWFLLLTWIFCFSTLAAPPVSLGGLREAQNLCQH
jgi:hypothetical protein